MKIVNEQVFITPKEAARIMGVNPKTIHRWCSDGRTRDRRPINPPDLQPLRGPNRRIYFRRDHVQHLATKFFGESASALRGKLANV